MKYNEEEILKQVIEYIKSTYNQHYSTDGKGLQAMDIFRNMDICLLYTSPSPRDNRVSRMPSSA